MARVHPRRGAAAQVCSLVIALAGPAVNFAIAFAGIGSLLAEQGFERGINVVLPDADSTLTWLIFLNMLMGVFNLIPAFPMDGGRILRALLAFKLDYLLATTIAANLGRVIAVLLGLLGIWGGRQLSIPLVLVAIFIYFGAKSELDAVRREREEEAVDWTSRENIEALDAIFQSRMRDAVRNHEQRRGSRRAGDDRQSRPRRVDNDGDRPTIHDVPFSKFDD